MLTETLLFRHLQRQLGHDIFQAFDLDYYRDILLDESLMTFSIYYPYLLKNVVIKQEYAIPSIHPQTGKQAKFKYKLPVLDPESPYIGIEMFYYPGNHSHGYLTGMNSVATDALYGKIASYLPTPQIRYAVKFEAPDIVFVDPIPAMHNDFALTMQRVRKLHEVPLYFGEIFKGLFVCDVKIAIYNELRNARDTVNFAGIEVNTYISEFSDAISKRDELIEKMQTDYYKNPERFEAIMQLQ